MIKIICKVLLLAMKDSVHDNNYSLVVEWPCHDVFSYFQIMSATNYFTLGSHSLLNSSSHRYLYCASEI